MTNVRDGESPTLFRVDQDGSPAVRIRLLGPVEMGTQHGPVRLSPLGRSLVAVLGAHSGRVVSVDRLVDMLWAGAPPSGARNRVQAAVSVLRRTLVEGGVRQPVVLTANPGYVLSEDAVWCD